MENLFDYATKELSQDAFIQWFINNYDDEEYGIKDISSSFVNFLMDKNNTAPISRNVKIVTKAQESHIDIVIEVYYDGEEKKHDVIVIEDKTFSSEHKQLVKYNDVISKWNDVENIYKVFYKIGSITPYDEKGVEAANKDQKIKWRIYNINTIWEFFNDKGNTKSQLLNDYVNYIKRIKESLAGEYEDNDVANWKYYQWEGYVKKHLLKYDNPDRECLWLSSYQGKYVTICYQRCLPNSLDAVVLEITVRENHLSTIFHHAFYDGEGESRKWGINEIKNIDKTHCEQLRNRLIDYTYQLSKKDVTIQQVDNKRAFKCFGKFVKTENADTINDLTKVITKWIDSFIVFVDKYNG